MCLFNGGILTKTLFRVIYSRRLPGLIFMREFDCALELSCLSFELMSGDMASIGLLLGKAHIYLPIGAASSLK